MNLTEARALVTKLHPYQGQIMKPYRAPVEDFIIVPARQQEFDSMYREIQENNIPYEQAVQSYGNNVSILVCFKVPSTGESPRYCHYDYFLFDNNISLE